MIFTQWGVKGTNVNANGYEYKHLVLSIHVILNMLMEFCGEWCLHQYFHIPCANNTGKWVGTRRRHWKQSRYCSLVYELQQNKAESRGRWRVRSKRWTQLHYIQQATIQKTHRQTLEMKPREGHTQIHYTRQARVRRHMKLNRVEQIIKTVGIRKKLESEKENKRRKPEEIDQPS